MGYPVVLNLTGKNVLIVGAGRVAERRLTGLAGEGASIVIVAPQVANRVRDLAAKLQAEIRERGFLPSDVDGAFLVHVATSDPAVNDAASAEAANRGALVCRADRAGGGDVMTPSAFRRGDLLVAVTTGGQSPTFAAVLQDHIEQAIGPEYETWTALFGRLRTVIKTNSKEATRKAVVRAILSDEETGRLVRAGDLDGATEAVIRFLSAGFD